MKKYPIHENLNTSFVNLKALVEFLRDLQFVGCVHIELSSYEADITFTPANLMLASEYDHIAGRISHGEDALRRVFVRAKEPCGRIHVYQATAEHPGDVFETIYVDETIAADARLTTSGRGDTPANHLHNGNVQFQPSMPVMINGMTFPGTDPEPLLPDLPFALSKDGGSVFTSLEEWNELLDLTSELLRTIDESLDKANFEFALAFENACSLISDSYPFIDPEINGFTYQNGWISISEQVPPEFFVGGITEALKRIFTRLSEEPSFSRVYRFTIIRLRLLVNRQKENYDKFVITPRLKEFLSD